MLKINKTTPPTSINSFDENEINLYWEDLKTQYGSDRLFFDSRIYCGDFGGDTFNFYDFSYKKYLFAKEKGLDVFSVGGMFIVKTSDKKILTILRSPNVVNYPNHLSIPGGFLSPNGISLSDYNSLIHLVSLELKEELKLNIEQDITPKRVEYIGHFKNINNSSIQLYFYIELEQSSSDLENILKLEKTEVSEVKYYDEKEFCHLLENSNQKLSPVISNLLCNSKKIGLDKYFSNDILSK